MNSKQNPDNTTNDKTKLAETPMLGDDIPNGTDTPAAVEAPAEAPAVEVAAVESSAAEAPAEAPEVPSASLADLLDMDGIVKVDPLKELNRCRIDMGPAAFMSATFRKKQDPTGKPLPEGDAIPVWVQALEFTTVDAPTDDQAAEIGTRHIQARISVIATPVARQKDGSIMLDQAGQPVLLPLAPAAVTELNVSLREQGGRTQLNFWDKRGAVRTGKKTPFDIDEQVHKEISWLKGVGRALAHSTPAQEPHFLTEFKKWWAAIPVSGEASSVKAAAQASMGTVSIDGVTVDIAALNEQAAALASALADD